MKKAVNLLFVLFLVGFFGVLLTVKSAGGAFSFKNAPVFEKKVIENPDIKRISANDMAFGDVKLVPDDTDKITVVLKGEVSERLKDEVHIRVKESNDELLITMEELDPKFWFGFTNLDVTTEIMIPQKSYDLIFLETSSGDIEANDFNAKQITLNASSGDIKAQNSKAKESYEAITSSGEINVKSIVADEIVFNAKSGDINGAGLHAKNSTIEASSGEIIIKDATGEITADVSSGNITIDNDKISGNLTATASSGDVIVNYKENPASLAVDYRGSSGEGNVNIKGFLFEEKTEDRILGKIGGGTYEVKVRTSSGDFELN
ncbi:DUF4097 family beta strand repeat-containing protein [Peribacillus glennii]|uniref:DUF4097 domain-containing protein n=1 Tax=Peribacillus glennii TaxID=2303991 RepID=A0A372L9E5_9BACI|nr:DUF4097 family beta strand repeat-containing protein [Peribacillus glennii]RFU62134.1 hypothetical protein D0466_16270 [Peribacillus glennii]